LAIRLRDQHVGNFLALVVSVAAATLAPLQTFIFVYAFVGPFHYLTEIAWLKKKEFYFGGGLVSPTVFVVIASLLCLAASVDMVIHRGITGYAVGLLLVLSLSVRVKNPYVLLAAAVAGYGAKFFVHGIVLFLAAVLPTIVHVYVFTVLFVVSGLLRSSERPLLAWLNPVLLLATPVVLLRGAWSYLPPGSYWVHGEEAFSALHAYLGTLIGRNLHPAGMALTDPAAVGVMRVLAFIYLYHYLNWFAKTELLKWHLVSRRSWVAIVVLYGLSIGCYLYSFMLGFYIVNFLSLLHVLLELPLNWHTGHYLASAIGRLGRRSVPQAATGDAI
jgi:hypothetical protein